MMVKEFIDSINQMSIETVSMVQGAIIEDGKITGYDWEDKYENFSSMRRESGSNNGTQKIRTRSL